jgi:hypothetical protein
VPKHPTGKRRKHTQFADLDPPLKKKRMGCMDLQLTASVRWGGFLLVGFCLKNALSE